MLSSSEWQDTLQQHASVLFSDALVSYLSAVSSETLLSYLQPRVGPGAVSTWLSKWVTNALKPE